MSEIKPILCVNKSFNYLNVADAYSTIFTGLKVEVTHCGTMRRKYRVCNVTRRPASLQTYVLYIAPQ